MTRPHQLDNRRRRWATLTAAVSAAAVLPAVVLAGGAAAATQPATAAHAAPRGSDATVLGLRLPEPTGPYPVGARSDSVSDPSRIDEQTGRPRRLPIRVWYPARSNSRGPSAPYLSPGLQQAVEDAVGAPARAFDVDTHAIADAAPRSHPRGVILVQPGGGSVTALQTGLVIELASRGYAVVAMEIPHESAIVEEPDGQVILGRDDWPFAQWRLDASVVLDDLRRLVPQARPGTPVGMFGHSRGGAATLDTMFHDARVSAGVSLDTGTALFFGDDHNPPSEVATAGLDQPVGLMCSAEVPCSSPHLLDFVPRLRGAHATRDLPILHNGYTDFVVFNPQAARVDPVVAATMETDGVGWPTGTLHDLRAGRAAMAAQRSFLVDFFDRHLDD